MLQFQSEQIERINYNVLRSFAVEVIADLRIDSPHLFHGLNDESVGTTLQSALAHAQDLNIIRARDLRMFIRVCFLVGASFPTLEPFKSLLEEAAQDGAGLGRIFDVDELDWSRAAVMDAVSQSSCKRHARAPNEPPAVRLTPISVAYAKEIWHHSTHPDIWRMSESAPGRNVEAIRARIARLRETPERQEWVILDPRGDLHGSIALRQAARFGEVSYWIRRDSWGEGYATAALSNLVENTPDVDLCLRIRPWNLPSCRVAEKCGFVESTSDLPEYLQFKHMIPTT